MTEVYVLIANENERVKECIVLPKEDGVQFVEFGVRKALQNIYGTANVTSSSRIIGEVPSNIGRYLAENSIKKGPTWISCKDSWNAPAINERYLVKLSNGWITIASYFYKKEPGSVHPGWKNDSGVWIDNESVLEWKRLE